MDQLSASARGWHSIQLAVLGFIGICGVLRTASGGEPGWLQWFALILAVAALASACWAILLVGRVAYPFHGAMDATAADPGRIAQSSARLRKGIRTTFVALALIVIAALSGWWPDRSASPSSMQVQDNTGRSWCGSIVDGPPGVVAVRTTYGVVAVPTSDLMHVRPVPSCG